ncbi:hypothetical protein LWI29_036734 [Acer saccharum]|uniref:Uncharacterized protein n=1 Tax=Acer saccharum TaxID=4024 RepID=A0AA39W557_ACESA|nr:hypothetical protein LWI29_036734 [Acer saccharum]
MISPALNEVVKIVEEAKAGLIHEAEVVQDSTTPGLCVKCAVKSVILPTFATIVSIKHTLETLLGSLHLKEMLLIKLNTLMTFLIRCWKAKTKKEERRISGKEEMLEGEDEERRRKKQRRGRIGGEEEMLEGKDEERSSG